MYRMMIVDDKDDIIQGIQSMGRWLEIGVEITGWANNGEEALAVMEESKPQIVITDIKMPVMDGIQLTESIKKRYPEIKVIILSGYDEFHYAQQALKLGAEEYLLKPIRIHQLQEVILRVIHKLNDEKLKQEEEAKILERLAQSLPLLRDKFLQRLLEEPGGLNEEELCQRLNFLEVDLYPEYLAVLAVEIDHYNGIIDRNSYQQMELLVQNLIQLQAEFNREAGKSMIFTDKKERFGWIVSVPGLNHLPEKNHTVFALAENISILAQEKAKVTVSIGIGRFYAGFLQLFHSYQEAVEALSHKFLLGANQIIHIDDVLPDPKLHFHYPLELEKELLVSLKAGTRQEGMHLLDSYFEVLDQYTAYSPKLIKKYLTGLVVSISRILLEMNIDEIQLTGGEEDLLLQITQLDTLEKTKPWLGKLIEGIYLVSSCEKKRKTQTKMEKAKGYIGEHMADEISLHAVANFIDLSPNYFTTLFKEYTGETFMDYVIRVRIDKAKELLTAGQFKVYEVANAVGYSDARYFSEIFKKWVGLAPAEYIKN